LVESTGVPAAQQQGQQQQGVMPSKAVPRPLRRHPTVHPWQLLVVYTSVLRGWRYRSSAKHGALQWRAVRELNRAARRLPQKQQHQQHQPHQQLWLLRQPRPQRMVQALQRPQRRRLWLRQVEGRWCRGAAVLQHRCVQLHRVATRPGRVATRPGSPGVQVTRAATRQDRSIESQQRPVAEPQQSGMHAGHDHSSSSSSRLRGSTASSGSSTKAHKVRSKSSSRSPRYGAFGVIRTGPWFEGALWPKQWRLSTLPSQQHTRS
jgi:hypothetical protein